MNQLFSFIASDQGKALRIVAGLSLVAIGASKKSLVLATAGLVPLSAGLFDWCFLAPLFSRPFNGEDLRREIQGI